MPIELVLSERIKEREIEIKKINREANHASHGLASIGKGQSKSEIWFQNFRPEIADAIKADCNIPT
jgi:hypothetical protein